MIKAKSVNSFNPVQLAGLYLIAMFVNILSADLVMGQTLNNDENLNLADKGEKIGNIVSFNIRSSEYENLKAVTGEELYINVKEIIINGDTIESEQIHTRGQSSLYFRRKSYNVKLKTDARFRKTGEEYSMKRFYLLNLSMDKYYSHNRIAFEMMRREGLFDLFFTFCEVRINGQSEGIYLVMERPEDWAIKREKAPLMLRRGYDQHIEKIEAAKSTGRDELRKYKEYFRLIYKSLGKNEGEALYTSLSGLLDMEMYMRWIAFNFLIRNGDYTDEVFFYIDPEAGKFKIIPWDYDDIFVLNPHEGKTKDKAIPPGSMIFSTEDVLDKKIATDPYLYKMYLVQLKKLIGELSEEAIKEIFETTFAELYPYYSKDEIISKSNSDFYKDATLENLKKELRNLYDRFLITRTYCFVYFNQNR
jgi:spore coat protein H